MKRACCGAVMMMAGLVSGCVDDANPARADTCGAAALAGFIGGPASALEGQTGTHPLRVIAPGTMVTMDMIPGRVNAHTDAEGIVLRITCG